MIDLNLQGSRRCRAKVITDVINDETAIVGIKGMHNHPVNIKREKPPPHLIGCANRVLRSGGESRMGKDESSADTHFVFYDDEEFDGSNNM